jgi:hypothetical protein
MQALIDELIILDEILKLIAKENNFCVAESKLKEFKYYNENRIDFLTKEGLIRKTSPPEIYILTQRGIVFIAGGGFEKEKKKQVFDRTSNLVYLLASPLIAILSLILSIIAISRPDNSSRNNKSFIPLNNIVDSCWISKDSSISKLKIIEEYSCLKSDTVDTYEMIKRQTIIE